MNKVDSMIESLIKKGVFTREEFDKRVAGYKKENLKNLSATNIELGSSIIEKANLEYELRQMEMANGDLVMTQALSDFRMEIVEMEQGEILFQLAELQLGGDL